jgi:hypothetical protein
MGVMKKRVVAKMVVLVSFLMVASCGCRGTKAPADPMMESFQLFRDWFSDRADVQQRIELAISKWQNGVPDPEPILMHAVIAESSEGVLLVLVTFDEDADVLGFVIEEERVDPNRVRMALSERYPVFTHLDPRGIAQFKPFPVQVRDEDQRKPDDQWQTYVSTPLQQLREEYMRRLNKEYASWRDTLPPVWVSVPEPNKVDVRLRVYDEAGHLSEPVSLFRKPPKVRQSSVR